MKLSIKRIDTTLPLPELHTAGAVGFDLVARENVTIPAGSYGLVPNNIVVQIPQGYALFIAARSSTLKKKGLMLGNGIGIIDQDYCGPQDEIMTLFFNPGTEDILVERGERWSQGILTPVAQPVFVEEEGDFRPGSRGGFGTTGSSVLP